MQIEYRHERLTGHGSDGAIDQLNHWGEQGWQIFHMERAGDEMQVWMSRERAITAGGLMRRASARRETVAATGPGTSPAATE